MLFLYAYTLFSVKEHQCTKIIMENESHATFGRQKNRKKRTGLVWK